MKRRLIKAGVLVIIFAAALVISSLVINRGTEDEIVDMGAPTIPRISFLVNGNQVNPLSGYVKDMEIPAMRDTITPLGEDGTLSMNLEEGSSTVSGIRYEVYSLDGEEKYKEGEAELPAEGEAAVLQLGNILTEPLQEAVLKVILETNDDRSVSYYTRIIRPDDLAVTECLAFAQDFQAKALAGDESAELGVYLEPGEESDNTTYQTVNIHSDITHILWGDLQPQVLGDVVWEIKESNSVYTSLLAEYQTACTDDSGETGVYNVSEFFRIRYVEGTVYMLDYNRELEKVFDGSSQAFGRNGIQFGIVPDEMQYETNEEGTIAAFVQGRNLWLYETEDAKLVKVFSFSDQEGADVRSRNRDHTVRIISMDNNGSIAFAVYGYMNRGIHEGEVGAAIYYFDRQDLTVEEKAFISSTKSAPIAEEELGKMVYYSQGQDMLYVLTGGTLYQIDLEQGEQTVLAEGLEEGQYALSDDGGMLAYQTDGSQPDGENAEETSGTGAGIQVLNLQSGEGYTVEAADGESVRPLGFINGDFVYGKARSEDEGISPTGGGISPMYEVEIRSSGNKEEASYSFEDQGIYITGVTIENNLLTLDRLQRDGDRYAAASQEYVTNNEERRDTKLTLETYSTDSDGRQVRLTFEDSIEGTEPSVSKTDQVAQKDPVEIDLGVESGAEKFYVYGMGSLAAVCDSAADAVQKAEEVSGVVVTSGQAYVWERGNRDLVYSTEAAAFAKEGEETSLEACERYMESYEAQRIDLTGCALDQVLYVINRGCPLIALTSADHAVLLTGYSTTDITYIDPDSGSAYTVGISEMESMIQGGGNILIGYVR